MAKSLEKIRREHASRPLVGMAPGDIEEKYEQVKVEVITHSMCQEPNCDKEGFRHTPRCETHHLRWLSDQKLEREERHAASLRYQQSQEGIEERARHDARVSRNSCDDCGQFLSYSERHAKLKVFDKKRKQPVLARDRYKILCKDCVTS